MKGILRRAGSAVLSLGAAALHARLVSGIIRPFLVDGPAEVYAAVGVLLVAGWACTAVPYPRVAPAGMPSRSLAAHALPWMLFVGGDLTWFHGRIGSRGAGIPGESEWVMATGLGFVSALVVGVPTRVGCLRSRPRNEY